MKYKVVEIFTSIQGEGQHMGRKATFIRLAGCNLKCVWCDTKFDTGKDKTAEDILNDIYSIEPVDPGMIVITGGEPTLWDLKDLLEALASQGLFVAIETNGTNPVKEVYGDLVDWVACSPKPDNDYKIVEGVYPDELKYVVDDNFRVNVIDEKYRNSVPIWLQPEGNNMQASAIRAYNLAIRNPDLKLGVQLHKIFNLQ